VTQQRLIESFALRRHIFRACFSLDGAATRAAESGEGGLSTTVVAVNDSRSRYFARIFRFHLANCTSRPIRATETKTKIKTKSYLLIPKLCVSSRDAYQQSEKTPINGLG
jgi:hypothetical protein